MKVQAFKILWFIVAFFSVSGIKSQTFAWAGHIGGTAADASYYTVTDASGNVYIVGGFSGTADFDPGVGTSTVTSLGQTDAYIVKLNSSGTFQWVRTFGGVDVDRVNSVSIDGSGNIYLTGTFRGTADFDPGPGSYTLSALGADVFISKLNSSGNFVWAGKLNGSGDQDANQILVDVSGNMYIVGEFTQTVDFDPGPGFVSAVANTSTPDMFILKLTNAGVFTWVRTLGSPGTNYDRAEDIEFDQSGNLVIVGDFTGTVDFDPGAGVFNLSSWGTNPDAFVLKLNSSGNFISAFSFGGPNWDKIEDVAIDGTGNIYVTGYFQSTVDFDPSPSTFTLASTGGSDIFVAKYTSLGGFLWAKRMGTAVGLSDTGYGIAVTSSGEVFSTGEYRGNTCDFDPGPGMFNLSAGTTANNIYVQRLDANGNFLFASQTGGANLVDYAGSVWFDAASNAIYICGSFSGITDLDLMAGTYTAQSAGLTDGFIIKLSTCVAPSEPVNVTSVSLQTLCSSNNTTLTTTSSGTVTWHSSPTSSVILNTGLSFVTPVLSAGNYTYYAQSNNSCGQSATRAAITITVISTPTINISTTSLSICAGQSTTLTASGAGTYSWSTGGNASTNIVSPTITTTYSVSGTTLGCTSLKATTISVSPSPTINIAASSSTLCLGQSATLTASGASTYTWSTGGNAATNVVSPTITTTYSVSGGLTSGCASMSTYMITVSICTELNELDLNSPIIIYPNPTSGKVTIKNIGHLMRVEVVNLLGQIISNHNINYTTEEINIVEEGQYFLKLFANDGSVILKKVIVKK